MFQSPTVLLPPPKHTHHSSPALPADPHAALQTSKLPIFMINQHLCLCLPWARFQTTGNHGEPVHHIRLGQPRIGVGHRGWRTSPVAWYSMIIISFRNCRHDPTLLFLQFNSSDCIGSAELSWVNKQKKHSKLQRTRTFRLMLAHKSTKYPHFVQLCCFFDGESMQDSQVSGLFPLVPSLPCLSQKRLDLCRLSPGSCSVAHWWRGPSTIPPYASWIPPFLKCGYVSNAMCKFPHQLGWLQLM